VSFFYGINFGVAFLLTVLLISKNLAITELEEKDVAIHPDIWLLFFMAVSSLIFLILALGSQLDSLPLFLKLFAGGSGFMLLPAFFFTYILALVGKSTRWFLLFTLPFVIHYSWQLWTGIDSDKFSFYHGLTVVNFAVAWEQWLSVIIFSSQALFPIAGLYQIEKHQQAVLERFSDLTNVDLLWVQRLLWGILIAILFAMLMVIPWENSPAVPFEWSLPILFSLISAQLLYIAYFGLIQSTIFINSPKMTNNVFTGTVVLNTADNQVNQSSIVSMGKIEQLNKFLTGSEIYQQSRLTIDELSNKLGWTVEDISDVINIGMEKNYFEFINEFRVQAIIQQMKQSKNQQATLLNIALHCGFNSKTAFNTTFKKTTGQTPSTFRKNLQFDNCPVQTEND